ncbi:copper-binding protein [Sulfuriferula thiophila]|uniref:copper-binding protein n=1 Tax=Sulfuriferula thiophila TaxID=1781211 RepID=UPI000F615CBE|nr:copper-binding protein [Sulfuriferula thiophila]
MKTMKITLIPVAIAAVLSFSAMAADTPDMAGMKMDAPKTVAGKTHHGIGVINTVNIKKAKVNITHEAISSLDWPAMTMNFKVTGKQALSSLKPGEKVEFDLSEQPKGQYVITKISPLKH